MGTHYWIDDPWHLNYFIDWIKDNVTERQDENLREFVRAFNAEHQTPIMTFRNSMEVSFNNQQPEYEKGIDVGDKSSMDAFLDEFLIHGA